MANRNPIVFIGVAMLSGIACALLALIALRADPWSNLDPAMAGSQGATGGGMTADEVIAVPLRKDNGNGDYLCVIAKTSNKSLIPDAGMKDEFVMVVYDMKGEQLQIKAVRPIQYELQSRMVYGNGGDCEPSGRSNLNELEPKAIAKKLKED